MIKGPVEQLMGEFETGFKVHEGDDETPLEQIIVSTIDSLEDIISDGLIKSVYDSGFYHMKVQVFKICRTIDQVLFDD